MRVSILGVITGGFADVVTSFLLGLPLAGYMLAQHKATHGGLTAVAANTTWARMHAHPAVWLAGILIGVLCSAFGGYVAATIAGHHENLNGILSCWLCVGMSILILPLGLNQDPWWLQAFFVSVSPVMGYVGGNLRFRQRTSKTRMATAV